MTVPKKKRIQEINELITECPNCHYKDCICGEDVD